MAFTVSVPDSLRQSVEAASGGRNTVLYDDMGYPSVMVVIPAFRLEDVDASLGAGIHPAFVVNGVTRPEIFVGKHLAAIHDGRALSLPAVSPARSIGYDAARATCTAKGAGWHLLTNAEWAAIALQCWKAGILPRGNTSRGKAHDAVHETGRRVDGLPPGDLSADGYTLTGSGPARWTHDGTTAGVADLVGNVQEWVAGFRLVDGEIQIIADNNAADAAGDHSAGSALWKAVAANGGLVAPGTAGTMKYDSVNAGNEGTNVGPAQLDDTVDNSNAPVEGASASGPYTVTAFQALAADAGIVAPAILKALLLYPAAANQGGGSVVLRNYGERMGSRGGSATSQVDAGINALHANALRTAAHVGRGFRIAYVA